MKKLLATCIMAAILSGTLPAMAQEPVAATPSVPAAPKPAWMTYQTPYVAEESDTANPHRTLEEISSWAQQAAADVLSFSPNNYEEKMAGFKKYFAPQGWQLYSAYLKDAHLLAMVTDNKYSVSTVVTSTPEIVNHGSAAGAYHWIIKLPITISFSGTDADGSTRSGPSGKYILFMDAEHVAQSDGNDSTAINNWRVDDVAKGK